MDSLLQSIDDSASWRKHELENLMKIGIVQLNGKEKSQDIFYKMCIPYVYSHWEGFVVESFKSLIQFLNNKNLDPRATISTLVTFSQLHEFKKLRDSQSFDKCENFLKSLNNIYSNSLKIDPQNFTTKSNLNAMQFQEILNWFNIKIDIDQNEKIEINKLVNLRNKIAHGENSFPIDRDIIEQFIWMLFRLFDKIIIAFDDYISNERYLRQIS